jgi:hypothetical protein
VTPPYPPDDNGHKEAKTLRVTMPSGKTMSMPADVAVYILEHYAVSQRKRFGEHLQAAIMGEDPS